MAKQPAAALRPPKAAVQDPRVTGAPAAPAAIEKNPVVPPDAPDANKAPVRERKKLAEAKVSVTVHTPFMLRRDDGTECRFHQGVQDILESDADHWYAKHHLDRNE